MTADTQEPDEEGDLPGSVIDELLADERRERLLGILRERDEPMVVEDLAAAVCATEVEPDGEPVTGDDRRAVRNEIFELHLPKLTAVDAVRYDSMVGTVEYVGAGALCDRLEPET